MMNKDDKIYIAGHSGLIGSAVARRLERDGYKNIVVKNHADLDLTNESGVRYFFEKEKPDYVFFAAAKVGGIYANNTYRAEFIYENIMMQNNIIHYSFVNEVKKLIFFASADVYPKDCLQPAKEDYLLTGLLEPTCEPFALAKITGIKMCESYNRQYGTDFIVIVPPNVYGPNQRYDIMNSQVLPSLVKKFHEAKVAGLNEVNIWGSGSPIRDFLFVDDVADACMFLMDNNLKEYVFNVGTGTGYPISKLAEIIKDVVGYKGKVGFDKSKPDGVSKKMLDTGRINRLGWKPVTDIAEGVKVTYDEFLAEVDERKIRTARICHIKQNGKDTAAIDNIKVKKELLEYVQPESYRDKVVIKPWGYEFLMLENELNAVWVLFIKKGFSTSMHSHLEKKTSLIILSGCAMTNTFSQRSYLRGGDTIIIDKGVFHSTKALSDDGVFLLEIETPPLKTDLLRLEDRYGREMHGYEGLSEMIAHNLDDYGYFYFKEPDSYARLSHNTNGYTIALEVFTNNDEFQKYFNINRGALYTCCRGILLDNNNVLLDSGNTQKGDILSNTVNMKIAGKTMLLSTVTKDR